MDRRDSDITVKLDDSVGDRRVITEVTFSDVYGPCIRDRIEDVRLLHASRILDAMRTHEEPSPPGEGE